MNYRIFILILILSCVILSCSKTSFTTEKELIEYIQEEAHGYLQKKAVNEIDFSLLYKPTDLLVSKDLEGTDKEIDVATLRDKYNKYIYFNLSISHNNQDLLNTLPKNRHEFGQMVQQLAFGMQDKVHLYTKLKDTIQMTDFVYPRMYGMSSATTILLVYPRDKEKLKSDFLYLTLQDLGIGTGEIKFKIPTDNINNQPTLTFKK